MIIRDVSEIDQRIRDFAKRNDTTQPVKVVPFCHEAATEKGYKVEQGVDLVSPKEMYRAAWSAKSDNRPVNDRTNLEKLRKATLKQLNGLAESYATSLRFLGFETVLIEPRYEGIFDRDNRPGDISEFLQGGQGSYGSHGSQG